MPVRRTASGLAAFVTAVLVGATTPAPAAVPPASAGAAGPDQELPFLCGQAWTGSTRAQHSPSALAVDFNRPDDLGRPVTASGSGTVVSVGDTGATGYGKWVRVQHPDGWSTVYAHLLAQWVVPGQFLDQGTPLGRLGASGSASGAHLHYEQRLGREVQHPRFHDSELVFGSTPTSRNCPDVPLAGDWDGDRSDEVAVFRRSAGTGTFVLSASGATPATIRFGRTGDLPVSGDWDGDGTTDVGVRRQSARSFLLRLADGSVRTVQVGLLKDVPVTGDWDGDGTTDLGVWRPGAARFRLVRTDGTHQVVALGHAGSQPVSGDWDADGRTDVGVFDSETATFTLRTVSTDGQVRLTSVPLGAGSDLPVSGDWDADGRDDVGTWAPDTATFTLRITPTPPASRLATAPEAELRTQVFGLPR